MSLEEYRSALKAGQKEYRACVLAGRNPYLQVLDERLGFTRTRGEEMLGLVDIPVSHVVGTKTEGRCNAFAANYMPLLEESSEFAVKWIRLADAHLKEGIRDPILAYEYLNRFYILEGNKRFSVLKHFGAVSVPGVVRRVLPWEEDTAESRIYSDFLAFHRATGVNCLWMSRPGRFQSLLQAVKEPGAPWSEEDRAGFQALYTRFRQLFKAMGGDALPGTTGDAFLSCVRIYGYPALARCTDAQLRESIARSWSEMCAFSLPQPVELALAPEEGSKGLLSKLLRPRPDKLQALFLYERSPEVSGWTNAHEEGRRQVQETFRDRVETGFQADVDPQQAEEAIRRGVAEGAQVIFTTSPKLLPATLKAAAEHPQVKFLNCSVYCPHPSIRTYYGRMFEVKFLSGFLAGAMSDTHRLGYIADYPIYGSIAAINAFALGARMADPWATVHLEWRCLGREDLWESLMGQKVDMLSGQDLRSPIDPWRAVGLYHVTDGVGRQVALAEWNWGRFYTRILDLLLEGEWRETSREQPKAINYWWGLSAGVVDFTYAESVPMETLRLLELLKEDMVADRLRPFEGRLVAQDGRVVQETGTLSALEIVKMDYLCDGVVGTIPQEADLTPEAQELCRIQGLGREERE